METNFPHGPHERALAISAFEKTVREGDVKKIKFGVKSSRATSLAFWRDYREKNPSLTASDIRALQRRIAALRKKQKRQSDRANGVGTQGVLITGHAWRRLQLGDYKMWEVKLSFIPTVSIGRFGKENLAKLQKVHEQLVKAVRLRGGAKKTTKHQSGTSVGRTVMSGGRIAATLRNKHRHVERPSGTIQLKNFVDASLQKETIETVTACVEEAFGCQGWYKAAKSCFANVPEERRLPFSSLPASNIWWSWTSHKSQAHIDTNVVPPCFVMCPYSYCGAELLCGNRRMPLDAGCVVGGSWHRLPHCNDKLLNDTERYSFVVYFDYRMLNESYLVK